MSEFFSSSSFFKIWYYFISVLCCCSISVFWPPYVDQFRCNDFERRAFNPHTICFCFELNFQSRVSWEFLINALLSLIEFYSNTQHGIYSPRKQYAFNSTRNADFACSIGSCRWRISQGMCHNYIRNWYQHTRDYMLISNKFFWCVCSGVLIAVMLISHIMLLLLQLFFAVTLLDLSVWSLWTSKIVNGRSQPSISSQVRIFKQETFVIAVLN